MELFEKSSPSPTPQEHKNGAVLHLQDCTVLMYDALFSIGSIPQKMQNKGNADQTRDAVRNGLCH